MEIERVVLDVYKHLKRSRGNPFRGRGLP